MDRDPSKTKPSHHRNRDERLNVIADLLKQGLTLAETGCHVGLSAGWVAQIARAHGLTGCSRAGGTPTGPAAVENTRVHPGPYRPQLLPAHGQGNREGLRP